MLLLVSTSDVIQIVTGQATPVDVHASYMDYDGASAVTPGRKNTAIASAATTSVVASPGSGVTRNVKHLNARNTSGTAALNVTVQHTDGTTVATLFKVTLTAGQTLEYAEGVGFFVIPVAIPNIAPNFSTSAQTLSAATLTQLAGSPIAVPASKLQIGTIFRWTFDITKTGAGTATSAYHLRIGTNNSTADAAILTFTKPAGTGVIDAGLITIIAVVRGPLTSSCVVAGTLTLMHNLSATGHAAIPGVVVNQVSSGFDATVANLFVSLSATTGASDAITIQAMVAEALNL